VTEIIERIARIGPDERLLGIVTLPAAPRPGAPAMLLLNAGVVHRIGPHRLNVKLARGLAQHGITSIRIDLSGLGDSPAAGGTSHFGEQALRDLQAAMAHLEQTQGIRRFVVFGLLLGRGQLLPPRADRRARGRPADVRRLRLPDLEGRTCVAASTASTAAVERAARKARAMAAGRGCAAEPSPATTRTTCTCPLPRGCSSPR
jgi:hypothetical protein